MLDLIALAALVIIGLLVWILLALRRLPLELRLKESLEAAISPLKDNFTSRLDSTQQSISTSLTVAIRESTQGLVTAIAAVKEETRSRIDERMLTFGNDLRAGFDSFREKVESQIVGTRAETQESLRQFSATLDKRSESLQTQVSSTVVELQKTVRDELASGRNELRESLSAASNSLFQAFEKLQTGNEARLGEIRQSLEAKLTENIEKNLGAFKEMTAGIAELKSTSDKIMQVSEEIGELTDILSSPKLRGDFGEFELENMLKDVIPPEHYRIKAKVNGALADAAIVLKEGLLCIDSKFPLDNYRRASDPALPDAERESGRREFVNDVWNYADSIAEKYIVPGVTLDFALMFVPAESVYYQILLDHDLQQHFREKKVVPVSPNTLFAYIQVLAIGFRGLKLQEAAKRIEEVLRKLKHDFDHFKDEFRLLGTHLQRAQDRFSDANLAAQEFSVTIDRLQLGAVEGDIIEAPALPPPTDQAPQDES